MALAQYITADLTVCELTARWGIARTVAHKLLRMANEAGDLGLSIISGFRTCEEQEALAMGGSPAVACALSTHTTCPATGVDLWTTPTPVTAVKARFGQAAVFAGLRWGGGSAVDPTTGIPTDWNHVDEGPRQPS